MVTERDAAICKAYAEGKTLTELAVAHHISRMRIRQIVRKAGIYQPVKAGRAPTGRDEFLGVNLTKEAKDALRQKAEDAGTSMSELVSNMVDDAVTE